MNIAVLGDGGWGTTLAILLYRKGCHVTLWGAFAEYSEYLDRKRINKKFLPGVRIPKGILITANLSEALDGAQIIILAVPTQYMRQVLKRIDVQDARGRILLSVAKGIENATLMRPSQIIKYVLGNVKVVVLSGPSIASEVAAGLPTTAVVSSNNQGIAKKLQEMLSTKTFRVYTNNDVVGVELGGSLKNIIAIACGASDGLGFGANAKAALLARGLSEMTRLGRRLGAKEKTFAGISGLGDLVTTCISPYSRNRFVGEEVGKGKNIKKVIRKMEMVAEGIDTTKSVYQLSRRYNVDMPITKEVYSILYKHKSPLKAVKDLMRREKKEE